MAYQQKLPALIEVDEKKATVEHAIDINNIDILRKFHAILIEPNNENLLKDLVLRAFGCAEPKIFKFLLELCRPTASIDINLMPDPVIFANVSMPNATSNTSNTKTLSQKTIECGKIFVEKLSTKKCLLFASTENMNGLAKFVATYYIREVPVLLQTVHLTFTIENYTDYFYVNMMQQCYIPIVFTKTFWYCFSIHFDFTIDFDQYLISKNLMYILNKRPELKKIGTMLNYLYYTIKSPPLQTEHSQTEEIKKIRSYQTPLDTLDRTEYLAQYKITHRDIYFIMPAIFNCVLLLKNSFLYNMYIYIVSGLIHNKGMIPYYMPIIKPSTILNTKSSSLINEWINNLKIFHSTLDPAGCAVYKIIPMLQNNSWRNKFEDCWDSSCFTLAEFNDYYKNCFIYRMKYSDEHNFVYNILEFLFDATNRPYDRLINNCIDECLKMVPSLDLREILHNCIIREYVEKFSKLVNNITPQMLRRAYLESKFKHKILSKKFMEQNNFSRIDVSYDYSNYYDPWLEFCNSQNHSIEVNLEKLNNFICKNYQNL